jgi:hypothetical protein
VNKISLEEHIVGEQLDLQDPETIETDAVGGWCLPASSSQSSVSKRILETDLRTDRITPSPLLHSRSTSSTPQGSARTLHSQLQAPLFHVIVTDLPATT